ncbi:MAG: NADH-quinone oxidoreductase subunit J [Chloroflexi bacterium]|nr:NADH-quinone oxidoreductase subunit J [Chloroflexota bacterium]MYD66716.1 NADH-quinone oxidoreductase subunit J [Chloroflexota bacterium]
MIERLPLPAPLAALLRRAFFPEGSFRLPLPAQLDRVIIYGGLVAGAVVTPILLVLIVLLVLNVLTAPELVFWLASAVIIGGALGSVLLKNIVHAALSLVMTLLGVAAIFLLLGSEFLALVQVLVYGGGVTVLLLFGLMLTNATDDPIVSDGAQKPFAFLVGIALAGILSVALVDQIWGAPTASTVAFRELGARLYRDFGLPFEIASLVLVIALIGAIAIARRDRPEDTEDTAMGDGA